jgi:lysozyme
MTRSVTDISHWEDPIDFKKVAADGIVAVIAKVTQGATGVDKAYAKFKKAAAPYKFLWGSYHFGTGNEVDVQVEHYLSVVKPTDREVVCLDFEPNPKGPTMTPIKHANSCRYSSIALADIQCFMAAIG